MTVNDSDLGAIGQDIWSAIKKAMAKAVQRNGARRNVVEVPFEFEECDIIFHAESRSHAQMSQMFDDAGAALMRLKEDMDKWMSDYNEQCTHSCKYWLGKTPMHTFLDSIPLAKEKMLDHTVQAVEQLA